MGLISVLSSITHMSPKNLLKIDKNEENLCFNNSDDEIFDIPKKKSPSLLKQLDWTEQMYCIQRYLESGSYPHFYLGSNNREKRWEFRHMARKTYTFDQRKKGSDEAGEYEKSWIWSSGSVSIIEFYTK